MDIKRQVQILCMANGHDFSRDILSTWENLILDDLEKNRYEYVDVENSLNTLVRRISPINNFGDFYYHVRVRAKERIANAKLKCPVCRREADIPAIKAIDGTLRMNCGCGEKNKDIIAKYQNNPVVQSLWGAESLDESLEHYSPPTDKAIENAPLQDVEYYD